MKWLAVVLVAILAAACQSPVSACEAVTSLLGTWRYSGMQDAPASAALEGSLEITSESCDGFQGRLDVTQSAIAGATLHLAGPVSGRVISGNSVRFDAWVTAIPRQHVASLESGTVEGSWVKVGDGSVETGSFRAERGVVR